MIQADHMLGIPNDTLSIQEKSILFYNNHRPNLIDIFWLTYYPKTSIVEIAQKEGCLVKEDIEKIEVGKRVMETSYLLGGDMKNPSDYYCVAFLLSYLPLLPKWLVKFLVHSKIYKVLKVKNYFLSSALPRVIQSIFNKNDFRGRTHIIRFLGLLKR